MSKGQTTSQVVSELDPLQVPVVRYGYISDVLGGDIYIARVHERIDFLDDDQCWQWRSTLDKASYGCIRTKNGLFKSHRVVAAMCLGLRIEKASSHVMHKCDNPSCCNPNHLKIGTHRQNMRDMFRKGRRKVATGENSSQSKLTLAEIKWIRRNYRKNCRVKGRRSSDIARAFGITRQHVNAIGMARVWTHLDG